MSRDRKLSPLLRGGDSPKRSERADLFLRDPERERPDDRRRYEQHRREEDDLLSAQRRHEREKGFPLFLPFIDQSNG